MANDDQRDQRETERATLAQANAAPTTTPERIPDIRTPISENPRHPVNGADVGVYYSRTDNLVVGGRVLSDQEQVEKLADAMRSVGPGKVMLIEASGPRDGDYTDDLRRTLPAALALVPENQRPEIRLFISDGRPVIGDQNNPNGPYNDFATFLQGLDRNKANSGTVQIDNSQSVPRAVPNWNNPEVVDFYVQNRVQPAVQLAKDLGIGTVVVDDHIGIPPGTSMDAFKRVNGFNDQQATNTITRAYERVLDTIDRGGLNTGISSAADPQGSLRMGIDMARLASRSDTVEIQGYRPSVESVQTMADNLYNNIANNFEKYRGVDEFRIALATRANNQEVTEGMLRGQQTVIDNLEQRLGRLYEQKGATPPEVNASLWAHQHFFEDPTLRRGDQGQRVTQLQEALNNSGIRINGEPLPTTGNFLDQTKAAVEQYQRQNNLAVTGEANKETQVALGIHPGLQFVQNTPQQAPVTPPTNNEQPTTPTPTPTQPTTQPPPVAPPANTEPTTPQAQTPTQPQPTTPPTAPPANEPVAQAPTQPQPTTPPTAPPANEPVAQAPTQPQPTTPPTAPPANEPVAQAPTQPQPTTPPTAPPANEPVAHAPTQPQPTTPPTAPPANEPVAQAPTQPQPTTPPTAPPANEPVAQAPTQPQPTAPPSNSTPSPEQPTAPAAPSTPQPAPTMAATMQQEGILMQGAQGPDVAAMQRQLAALGYTGADGKPLAPTGNFDANTTNAVKAFEKDAGIAQNGIVGPTTMASINQAQSAMETVTRDPLYAQAQEALKKLPEGTFANEREMNNMAGALVRDARMAYQPPSEMQSIAEVRLNTRGDGLIALEKGGDDAMQRRTYVNMEDGKAMSLVDSGRSLQQEGLTAAGQRQQTGQQQENTAQRPEQQNTPVLTTLNTQEPENQPRMRMA